MPEGQQPDISVAFAAAALRKGQAYVPDRGDFGAPKAFKGDKPDKLESFLRKVDKILTSYEVTNERECAKILFEYLGGPAKTLFREHPSYKAGKYDEMLAALRSLYPSRRHRFKYSSADLERIAKKWHKKKWSSLEHVAAYRRKFESVGLWCLNNKKVEPERYNRIFWDGLPKALQRDLKVHGSQWGLKVDLSKTPGAKDVFKALCKYFSFDDFDADLRYKRKKSHRRSPSSSSSELDSDSDSDSSDSEDDDSDEKGKRKHKSRSRRRREEKTEAASSPPASASTDSSSSDEDSESDEPESKRMTMSTKDKKKKGKVHFSDQPSTSAPAPPTSASQEDPSIEQLARQLANLDVHSAEYRSMWVRMAEKAPTVAANIPRPAEAVNVNAISAPSRVPPHLGLPRSPGFARDFRCFGCGGANHQMRDCEALKQYLYERILVRDSRGYYRMGDQSPLPAYSAENPLVKALRDLGIVPRSEAPATASVPTTTNSVIYPHVGVIQLPDAPFSGPISVYGAARRSQDPSERAKPYERPPTPQSPAARTRSAQAQDGQGQPVAQGGLAASAPAPTSAPAPAAAASAPQQAPPIAQAPLSVVGDAEMTEAGGEKKRQTRRYTLTSELGRTFPVRDTLQKIIDNPIMISTGELLAQPELQKALAPMLQRHKSFDANAVRVEEEPDIMDVAFLEPKISRVLFSCGVGKVQVRVGNSDVTALLDPGSEINVINRTTCDRLRLPLTPFDGTMRNADGRLSPMNSRCCNVELEVGGVRSRAHLYVVEGPSYELLLGRPWQRHVRYQHRDIDEGLLATIYDPTTNLPYSFIAAPAEQSDPRSSHSSRGIDVVREVSHLMCSSRLEELLEQEDNQQEEALLAGELTDRQDDKTPSVLTMYKPIARKVRPVATNITEDDRVKINIPPDFEDDLPQVPFSAPAFQPRERLTQARLDELDLDPDKLLNEEERKILVAVIRQNELTLAFDETEKGVVDSDIVPPVKIPVVEHTPWHHRNIPIPAAIKKDVLRLLQDKVDSGLYEPSSAGYTSKWFAVAKKQKGQYRIVHNLQPLNGVSARNPGGLPQIDAFVGELSGKACIGTLDHFSGFDQVWLAVESRDFTTFETELGRLRHTRLPQGGTNSCMVFHYIVVAIVGRDGKVYVDDTFIPGPDSTYDDEPIPENPKVRRFVYEYLVKLNRVLFRVGKAKMTISARKMAPIRRTADVLGQEVSPEGRRVAKGKVEAIEKWTRCSTVSEVRSFLGIAGQARAWIPNYSAVVKPLTNLTRKGVVFDWGEEQQTAMDAVKQVVAQRTHLVELKYGEDMKPIKLGVDAGPLACGFWLGQDDEGGVTHVARYGSLPFNDREQAYSQAKRELYAIFRALKFFRHWLWGTRVIVLSDAMFIKGMLANPELPNSAMTRWLAYVILFDLAVQHVKAKDNELADGLSRRPPQPDDVSVTDDEEWLTDRLEDLPSAGGSDETQNVDQTILEHSHSYSTSVTPDPSLLLTSEMEPVDLFSLLVDGGNVSSVSADVGVEGPTIRTLSDEHQGVFDFLALGKKPAGVIDFASNKRFLKKASQYFVAGRALWRRGGIEGAGRLVVDEKGEQERLMGLAHEESGHKGVQATAQQLEKRYFWTSLWADVRSWVETCDACQKRERSSNEAMIRPTAPPDPFQRIGLDITYMPKVLGRRYLVVVRDDLSGWVEARALKRKTARAVARFLVEDVLTRHGLPLQVTTDQGTEFKGIVDVLLNKYKVDITRTSPYNPRANGAVERGHGPLKEAIIHIARLLDVPWPQAVELACWIDRTTVRRQYGHSPFFLLHGHEPLLPLDLAGPLLIEKYQSILDDKAALAATVADRINRLASHQLVVDLARKAKTDARAFSSAHRNLQGSLVEPNFSPGQLVLIRNLKAIEAKKSEIKLQDTWHGPYKVVWQGINGEVHLSTLEGIALPSAFHPTHVKRYRPRIKALLQRDPATTTKDVVEKP